MNVAGITAVIAATTLAATLAAGVSANDAGPASAADAIAAGAGDAVADHARGARSQAYAVAVRDMAPVDLHSSCATEAIADVNRGAALLLALAPLDARRAFERAAEQDPDCALAGWGRAMTWLPGDPRQFSALGAREGRDAIRRAASTPAHRATARERKYVASAAIVFDPSADVPLRPRLQRYRDAMRDLATAFPEDPVGTIMFARAALLLSTVPDDDDQREAATIVERRFGPTLDRAGSPQPASARSNATQPGVPQAGAAQAGAAQGGAAQGGAAHAAAAQVGTPQLGAALTLLLARDFPGGAPLARPAAEVVARLAASPLARHLPARTFTRLGEWSAAAASTEAAIVLAGSPVSPRLVYGQESSASDDRGPGARWLTRDVAAEWLVEAYLQQGRIARASALIDDVRRGLGVAAGSSGEAGSGAAVGADAVPSTDAAPRDDAAEDAGAGERRAIAAALTRMHARFVLARADWTRGHASDTQAVGCDAPTASPAPAPPAPAAPAPRAATGASREGAACPFIQAYSAARLAWPGARPDRIEEAARMSVPLGAGGPPSVTELLRILVRAAMAAGQEEHPELELLATFAIDLEERLLRSGQLVLPLAPAQELLGDLFLQANRFEQARSRYRSALVAWPNRARSVLGVARASVRLDDRDAATAAYRQLLQLWTGADPDLPELAEARRWLGGR